MSKDVAELLMNVMIFLPLAGIPFILLAESKLAKYIALGVSLLPLLANLVLYVVYLSHSAIDTAIILEPNAEFNSFVLDTYYHWFGEGARYSINYITGMDGISVYLVLLTTFLFPLTIYFSWGSVDKYEKSYYALLLVLEVGVIGFFLALDMVLFYLFFEMVLIPMYFLIGIWGGKERIYASVKFFLYTLVGSLLMLIAIIYLGWEVNNWTHFTSDFHQIINMRSNIEPSIQRWLFAAFALSFAIKVPLFPLHTWLPDAHTQAPTSGSVILAGVLLKMGTYGMIRFCLPIFPDASQYFAPLMCGLAVVGIIYGGMAAMVQKDVKKLVAYSSVSHLGFIVLGIFSFTPAAMTGAVIQMVNHGISTGALFLLVGMIYDRRHTRMIEDFQGLAKVVPVFTLFFMITVLSSVGLPGLNGFVGEFMVLVSSFNSDAISGAFAIIAASGVIVAAVYLLWMFRRVMFGTINKDENRQLKDLNTREVLVLVPMVVLMFFMGLYPKPFLKEIDRSSDVIVEMVIGDRKTQNYRAEENTKPVILPLAESK